jgi:hypothetical protein
MAASSAASQQPAGPAATVRPRAHRQSLLPPPASATILLLRLPPLARALRAAPSLPRPRRQQSMLRMMMGLGKSYTLPTPEEALPGRERPIQSGERHYVLKTPLHGPWPEGYKKLIFANGCFWGSEKGIWRLPGGGIHSTAVGYAAGFTPNPTYEEACSGKTGHTEAVQVVYDPAKTSLVDILRWCVRACVGGWVGGCKVLQAPGCWTARDVAHAVELWRPRLPVVQVLGVARPDPRHGSRKRSRQSVPVWALLL